MRQTEISIILCIENFSFHARNHALFSLKKQVTFRAYMT